MAFTFHNLQKWLWRNPNPKTSSKSNPNPNPNPNPDPDTISRNTRRLAMSRPQMQSIDRDFDLVIVTPTNPEHYDMTYSGSSESDEASTIGSEDWSIGWFEPHAREFSCMDPVDAEQAHGSEDSFAVLVPCYGGGIGAAKDFVHGFMKKKKKKKRKEEKGKEGFESLLATNQYLQQWLSSLQA